MRPLPPIIAYGLSITLAVHCPVYAGDCDPQILSSHTFDEIGTSTPVTGIRFGQSALYVLASEPVSRFHVIDFSDPSFPEYVSAFPLPDSPRDLWFDDGHLYVTADHEGVQIYDCTDPLSPTLVSVAPTATETPFVRVGNGRLYTIGYDNQTHLTIYDVSNPSSPTLLSSTPLGPTPNRGHETVVLHGDHLFIEDGSFGGADGFVLDVHDPMHPTVAFTFSGFANQIVIKDDIAFRAPAEGASIAVYDVSNPGLPSLRYRINGLLPVIDAIIVNPPYLYTVLVENSPTPTTQILSHLYSAAGRWEPAGTITFSSAYSGQVSNGQDLYAFGRDPHLTRIGLPSCPGLCGSADLALPLGVLSLNDITTFTGAFVFQQPTADFTEPFGVFDLADVVAFVTAFNAGCP